jgi:hypothetical protein
MKSRVSRAVRTVGKIIAGAAIAVAVFTGQPARAQNGQTVPNGLNVFPLLNGGTNSVGHNSAGSYVGTPPSFPIQDHSQFSALLSFASNGTNGCNFPFAIYRGIYGQYETTPYTNVVMVANGTNTVSAFITLPTTLATAIEIVPGPNTNATTDITNITITVSRLAPYSTTQNINGN